MASTTNTKASSVKTPDEPSTVKHERPYNGWGALKPDSVLDWIGLILAIIFGLAIPWLGILLVVISLYIVFRADAPDSRTVQQRKKAKAMAELRFCPNCDQNVRPVRRATASKLALTGGVGYAMSDRDACPMCKAQTLEPSREAWE